MSQYINIGLTMTWFIVVGYWVISGFANKKAEKKESTPKRVILYWFPFVIAIVLLGPGEWYGHHWLRENFVEHTNFVGLVGLFISISGAFVACLSRYMLGNNWSLSVQQKVNHKLVKEGIYSIVRHPIYSGILLLFIGNALIVGDYRAIIAVCIIFISFWYKLKKEEKWMIETFGETYIEYTKTTKALIPYLF